MINLIAPIPILCCSLLAAITLNHLLHAPVTILDAFAPCGAITNLGLLIASLTLLVKLKSKRLILSLSLLGIFLSWGVCRLILEQEYHFVRETVGRKNIEIGNSIAAALQKEATNLLKHPEDSLTLDAKSLPNFPKNDHSYPFLISRAYTKLALLLKEENLLQVVDMKNMLNQLLPQSILDQPYNFEITEWGQTVFHNMERYQEFEEGFGASNRLNLYGLNWEVKTWLDPSIPLPFIIKPLFSLGILLTLIALFMIQSWLELKREIKERDRIQNTLRITDARTRAILLNSTFHHKAIKQLEEKKAFVEGRHKILIADDAPENFTLITFFLQNTGCELDHAMNGKIALEKMMQNEYQIVLMDMQMPVMDGYEAVQQYREWEKEQDRKPIPIIALTAYALKEDEEKCLIAGCTDYLSKPVNKEKLIQKIEEDLSY